MMNKLQELYMFGIKVDDTEGFKLILNGYTGRNKPCVCGSGKKFKKCCKGKIQYNNLGNPILPVINKE